MMQNHSKMAPRWLRNGIKSRCVETVVSTRRDFFENGPFLSQDGSEMAPRWRQDDAKFGALGTFQGWLAGLMGQPASAAFTDHMTDSVVW